MTGSPFVAGFAGVAGFVGVVGFAGPGLEELLDSSEISQEVPLPTAN
jgi:hypothetical protein